MSARITHHFRPIATITTDVDGGNPKFEEIDWSDSYETSWAVNAIGRDTDVSNEVTATQAIDAATGFLDQAISTADSIVEALKEAVAEDDK